MPFDASRPYPCFQNLAARARGLALSVIRGTPYNGPDTHGMPNDSWKRGYDYGLADAGEYFTSSCGQIASWCEGKFAREYDAIEREILASEAVRRRENGSEDSRVSYDRMCVLEDKAKRLFKRK